MFSLNEMETFNQQTKDIQDLLFKTYDNFFKEAGFKVKNEGSWHRATNPTKTAFVQYGVFGNILQGSFDIYVSVRYQQSELGSFNITTKKDVDLEKVKKQLYLILKDADFIQLSYFNLPQKVNKEYEVK